MDFIADTGAEVSVLSEDAMMRTKGCINRAKPTYNLKDASCNKMLLIGEATVNLQLGSTISTKSFPIVSNLKEDCLIGRDILSSHINLKQSYYKLENAINECLNK